MQRVVFDEKIPAFLAAYKRFYTFKMSSTYLYILFFLYKNYLISRNVAVEYFSLIVFAVKALKSDVLCSFNEWHGIK